jgi:hypothetical protein
LLNGAAVVDIDNTKTVYFDGVNDYATIPRFDIRTTDFTIAVWFKPKSPWDYVNTLFEDFKDGQIQFTIFFYEGGLTVDLRSAGDMKTFLGIGYG